MSSLSGLFMHTVVMLFFFCICGTVLLVLYALHLQLGLHRRFYTLCVNGTAMASLGTSHGMVLLCPMPLALLHSREWRSGNLRRMETPTDQAWNDMVHMHFTVFRNTKSECRPRTIILYIISNPYIHTHTWALHWGSHRKGARKESLLLLSLMSLSHLLLWPATSTSACGCHTPLL